MKPVSFMTSRMSVNGTRGKKFQRLEPSPHLTFLLAGSAPAARVRVAASMPRAVRLVRVRTDMAVMLSDLGRCVSNPKQGLAPVGLFLRPDWRDNTFTHSAATDA